MHEDYPEIAKYRRKGQEVEYRLRIDLEEFLQADEKGRDHLVCRSLLRSLYMLPEIGVKDCDYSRLIEDFKRVCYENGWLEKPQSD